jgi:bifunctional UDP-N-acetylglucosamine pyrophosphorylase/glucosamine-1-phosphate N-acetyltransferase
MDVLILAAGLGTRMKSARAKVLHELGGLPLVAHVVRAALELHPDAIITVVGHQADKVEGAVRNELGRANEHGMRHVPDALFVTQGEQRGTGHAVLTASSSLTGRRGPVVVIAGDVPLIKSSTLRDLIDQHTTEQNDATILTTRMDDPTGYGRIVRDDKDSFCKSVEQRDANPQELDIPEVNVSIYCFSVDPLLSALKRLTTDNAQGEYYLTDVPGVMKSQGLRVGLLCHPDSQEVAGVNNRIELADLERKIREQKLRDLMLSGVTIMDPSTTYIAADVRIGQDTVIYPQVIIEGGTNIGSQCTIHSWVRLKNATIGSDVTIKNSTVVEDSAVGDRATVGPFARLRMHADIGEDAGVGNFVEVKKSRLGKGTKAAHLTYLGDATLGDKVNIGAGTVTCNYDGVSKHETIIEDEVKIGSDTMLVAPVRVGRGSKTGAGSVVTKDVPPDTLVAGVPATIKKKLK